ncbi:fibronectin type III-like domain-contianing protein [Actinoallomurus sp. NPDC050550]|uniref:fibronectin type III-like domain-contianing protein n=1 Tax=Actinoallomurus sp. NPDC050550 TaxID=3154937 RepID=UPI0033DFFFA4
MPQLYVSTPFEPAAKERPLKRLEAFQKVTVGPHRTTRVGLTVPVSKLAFFDEASNRYVVDGARTSCGSARPAGTPTSPRGPVSRSTARSGRRRRSSPPSRSRTGTRPRASSSG